MLLAALGLVYSYGTRTLPQNDELWALYDAGPGIQPSWLWKPWAEHRMPLAKLLWKSVLEVTGYDFRAGNFLTVALLGLSSLAMIWTARAARGRTILADALFPLAILNFGQAQVFLWWWQVNHVLAPLVAIALLWLVVRSSTTSTMSRPRLFAAGLVLIALCGPGGLPYVVALVSWLVYSIAARWTKLSTSERSAAGIALAISAIAVLLVGLYFVDYTPYFPANEPTNVSAWPPFPGLVAGINTGLQMLALSLGTATKRYTVYWGFVVLVAAAATVAVLVTVVMKNAAQRLRASALLAFLVAAAVLVLAIVRARAGMGLDYIYQGHYLTLLAPALCCSYFAWELSGHAWARIFQYGMALILAVLLPWNFSAAVQTGKDVQARTQSFNTDVRAGIPAFVLAERHFASDVVPQSEKLTQILLAQKRNGIGIFTEIREDPEYRTTDVDVATAIPEQIASHDGIFSPASQNPRESSLVFSLPRAEHVYAVRLRYSYVKAQNPWPTLRFVWRNVADQAITRRTRISTVAGPEQPIWALVNGRIQIDARLRTQRTLTVWIDEAIDQFRIYPESGPYEFKVSGVQLIR